MEINGGPTTKAAHPAWSIQVGNAQVVPLSTWTKTTSPSEDFWRLWTGRLCPKRGCQR
jgi:hypothetical protein